MSILISNNNLSREGAIFIFADLNFAFILMFHATPITFINNFMSSLQIAQGGISFREGLFQFSRKELLQVIFLALRKTFCCRLKIQMLILSGHIFLAQ